MLSVDSTHTLSPPPCPRGPTGRHTACSAVQAANRQGLCLGHASRPQVLLLPASPWGRPPMPDGPVLPPSPREPVLCASNSSTWQGRVTAPTGIPVPRALAGGQRGLRRLSQHMLLRARLPAQWLPSASFSQQEGGQVRGMSQLSNFTADTQEPASEHK